MKPPVTEKVVLRRLTTTDLPAIARWFEDHDTGRYLGGPTWPAMMLGNAQRALGKDFRGAVQIDPTRRREGLATAMLRALISHPDLAAVELFEAGVDPENHASRQTLEAAGFRLRSPEHDVEEMVYYELRAAVI